MFPHALFPVHLGGPFDSFPASTTIPIDLALLSSIELGGVPVLHGGSVDFFPSPTAILTRTPVP